MNLLGERYCRQNTMTLPQDTNDLNNNGGTICQRIINTKKKYEEEKYGKEILHIFINIFFKLCVFLCSVFLSIYFF